jgi:uroporphyrinogen decarboxylase
MNAKQAVNDVLNRKQPAYIPLGTYAIDCDTAARVIGHETYVRDKVKIFLALMEGRRDEVVQSLKEDSVDLFRKLDCIDLLLPEKEAQVLPPKDYVPPKYTKLNDNTWQDEHGDVYRIADMTNDVTLIKHGPRPDIREFDEEPVLTPLDESIFEAYDHFIAELGPERFIAGLSGGLDVFPLPGGMEEGLLLYALEPEYIHRMIEYSVKIENYLDPYFIRDGVDQVMTGVDLGTTTSLLLSPAMFEEFCLPAMKTRVAHMKKYRSKMILHSCGNTWKIIDRLIEAGVDCYQSLQTGAGMDIGKLNAKYGGKMAFWGGVAVEKLIGGTPQDVRADVRYAMQTAGPGGGFILGPSHSIAYGVKYENFMAMIDEHDKLKYTCYKLPEGRNR